MADKNLHDIKIDDLESGKKSPLKNLLTLLALLFIILVISVVITKLILNTDNDNNFENNATTEIDANGNNNALAATGAAIAGVTGAVIAGTHNSAANTSDAVKNTATNTSDDVKRATSNLKDHVKNSANTIKEGSKDLSSSALKERNLTASKTKVTLRDHRPPSAVKELVSAKSNTKSNKSSTSHKSSASHKNSVAHKNSTSHKNSVAHKNSTSHKNTVSRKRINSDKVVSKKSNSSKKHSVRRSLVGHTLTPGYYIKIGTFKNPTSAVKQIKKTGLNYKLIKVKDDKTLTRVFIGTFSSRGSAQSNLSKAKKISKGAYIIKK